MNLQFAYTEPDEPRGIQSTFMTRLDGVMIQWRLRRNRETEKTVTWLD